MSKTILNYGGLVSRASFYLRFLDYFYGFEKRLQAKHLPLDSVVGGTSLMIRVMIG